MNKTQVKVSIPLERSLYLLHPYAASLVTCRGKNGKSNVMAVAWIIPISVDPPMLAMSIRRERHSYGIILETRQFVANIPTFEMAQKVLICGRRSGVDHDKFKEASLFPQKAARVNAPLIQECVAHLECEVFKTVEVGDHTLIIGRIVAAQALDGFFSLVYDVTKFQPCLHIGKNFFTTWMRRKKEPKI